MTLNKATHYALYAALEMARAGEHLVTVAEVASRYGIPESALAKVFQQLVRSGVAVGVRGTRGGYRLSRPTSRVTLLDVISVFEPPPSLALGDPSPRTSESAAAPLRRVFDELDELVRCTFASITLGTLVRRGEPKARHPEREAVGRG
jgi:Rrf2 family transcriptional regulator, iron-sulfur cluster assembly transcription factor